MSYGPPGNNPFPNPQGGNPYAAPGMPGKPSGPLPPGTVKNYLVEAILCLVCCNILFAIPAIIYASQVNGKLQAGDYQGAVEASQNAKKWCLIAVVVGLVCTGISAVVQIMAVVAGNH